MARSDEGIVLAFLVDAVRSELSSWTVINVLRQWANDGMCSEHMLAAVGQARNRLHSPREREHLDEYEDAIRLFIREPGQ